MHSNYVPMCLWCGSVHIHRFIHKLWTQDDHIGAVSCSCIHVVTHTRNMTLHNDFALRWTLGIFEHTWNSNPGWPCSLLWWWGLLLEWRCWEPPLSLLPGRNWRSNKKTTNQQVLDPATLSFTRRSNNSQNPPRRQRASVTEVSRPHSLTKGSSTPNTI